MIGAGSTELLLCLAAAVGGGGSMVYAWPSFIMYRIAAKLAGCEPVEVPLDVDLRHDPDALAAAVRADTKALFVCNPNNPTGTHLGGEAVHGLIDRVPDDVLVVIDEAYHEYVQATDYESMLRVDRREGECRHYPHLLQGVRARRAPGRLRRGQPGSGLGTPQAAGSRSR